METINPEVKNSSANAKADKKKSKPNFKYLRDKYREPVRGKFIFHEVPGGTLSFPYREFKEDSTERYDLKDGEIYTIPLGVARHLNKNCWYPVHHYLREENGSVSQRINEKVRRCSFQSLEFIDTTDITPEGSSGIVTVENV